VLFSTDIVSGFKLLLSKNLSSDGQSAGNQSLPSHGGEESSETIREGSFDFTYFYKHHKYIDPEWLQWFIGFSEGAILESKGRLYFVIGQKDIQVLYHIQEVLGFGKVNVYPDKEYGRFVVMGF